MLGALLCGENLEPVIGDACYKDRVGMSANSGVYWLLVMTGFFAYSFITEDWGQSWIIWPVAGVLFAALMVGLSYWVGSRQENRQDA